MSGHAAYRGGWLERARVLVSDSAVPTFATRGIKVMCYESTHRREDSADGVVGATSRRDPGPRVRFQSQAIFFSFDYLRSK
jgi:hypothetical protein